MTRGARGQGGAGELLFAGSGRVVALEGGGAYGRVLNGPANEDLTQYWLDHDAASAAE